MDSKVVTARIPLHRRSSLILFSVILGVSGQTAISQAARPNQGAKPGTKAGAKAGANPDRRAMEARKACAAGRVERGIELLAQLIAESGDPNAVFNQARCYQANGRNEQALARFREYLRIAENVQVGEADMVRRFIEELEEIVERKRGSAAPPPPLAAAARTATPTSRPAPATPNRATPPVSGMAAVAPAARARGPRPPPSTVAAPVSSPSPAPTPNRAAAAAPGIGTAMPKVSTPNRPVAPAATGATAPAVSRLAMGTPNRPALPAPGRMAAPGSVQAAVVPGRTAASTPGRPVTSAPGGNAAPAPTRIASAAPAPIPPPAPAKDTAATDTRPSATPNIVAQAEPTKPVDWGRRWRIVAVATAAAAVVPLAMGIYYGRYANRIEREIETQTTPLTPRELDSKLRRGSTATNRQWMSYALAGTMLAGSGALFLFGPARRAEPAAAKLDVSPLITDRAAGALVTGRF